MTAHSPTLGVVINPASGRGRARAAGRSLVTALTSLGLHCVVVESPSREGCELRVAEIAERVDGFVLVGGDGLVASMVQLSAFRAKPFAVFPAGTGNDFASAFGFASSPRVFSEQLIASLPRPVAVDAGTIAHASLERPLWFAAHVCFGLVARVNARANAYRFSAGSLGYKVALVRELLRGTFDRYRFTRGGRVRDTTELLMTVMNTPMLGGGIRLVPQASPHDGLLDVITVARATRRRIFSVLPLLATARHEHLPEIQIERHGAMTIGGDDLEVYADGDVLGVGPVDIVVQPAALMLWHPATRR
ncbi:MAG: diacylglycerol/lipid kinase family protein [Microbacteriaceae bacterium]